jgi:F-type H+-transporting ATPase subunit gamma
MKALASSNILQFQSAADASQDYRRILDMSLSVVMADDGEQGEEQEEQEDIGARGSLHIVFGSDYGLAGRFNERISTFALDEIPPREDHFVVAVGHQVESRMDEHLALVASFGVPQTVDGITSSVQRLLTQIEGFSRVAQVWLYYNRPVDGINFTEVKERLLPLSPDELIANGSDVGWKSLPTYFVEREALLSHLLQQYFFITLYRAFCYSLAAENASRLASMQGAERNIRERKEELNFRYRLERQNNITAEINDVISGFKAIQSQKLRRR